MTFTNLKYNMYTVPSFCGFMCVGFFSLMFNRRIKENHTYRRVEGKICRMIT